jgi:hypothetical protein
VLGSPSRGQRHQAEAAGRRRGVHHAHPPPVAAVAAERLHRLARRLARAGEAAGDVDRHDVAARVQQGLVHGEEVAHRRLRGGGQRVGRAQLFIEGVEVPEIRLAHRPLAAEVHVQRDELDLVEPH